MHKLIEFICDELDDLERKAERGGKLSMTEVQYGDMLAHFKKNLLKSEEMMDGGYSMDRYSGDYSGDYSRSYSERRGRGRNANRYSRDGYSMDDGYSTEGDFKSDLEDLMEYAPNDQVRQKLQAIMSEVK